MKILTVLLLILFTIAPNTLAQPGQKPSVATPTTNTANAPDNEAKLNQEIRESKDKITRLENEVFWLALLAALGFILPLPLGIYHIYRRRDLTAQFTNLEAKLKEQTAKASQIEALIAKNTTLENEIKQIQERFRTSMKSTQEKHQEAIERMKNDMHLMELENKRISGILMLKEQVAKKSFPGT